jgi:hypothetical protein
VTSRTTLGPLLSTMMITSSSSSVFSTVGLPGVLQGGFWDVAEHTDGTVAHPSLHHIHGLLQLQLRVPLTELFITNRWHCKI